MTAMVTRAALAAAQDFVWRSGRLLDRHRFAYHFTGGDPAERAQRVLAALLPYRNPDGGFGNALEPDLRGPESQPEPVDVALGVLDEIGAFDTETGEALVRGACDYLASVTAPDGGVPFVLPSVRAYPRAPWWETPDDPPGGLIPTAGIAGLLHKHGVRHQWLDGATDFCWRRLGQLDKTSPYEMLAVLPFLENVPDRDRAAEFFARVGPKIRDQNLVALDPGADGEVHFPLDFAPAPSSLARRLFADEEIDAHLAALVAAQRDDGGWTVNWHIWTPAAGLEWRAWITVHRLLTLRAYGRLAETLS